MTTIAWYEAEALSLPSTADASDTIRVPLTTNTGILTNIDPTSIAAGFVGEPVVAGVLELVTDWVPIGLSAIPSVSLSTYDKWDYYADPAEIIATHQYIHIGMTNDQFGVLTIRVKVDGVYCEGLLTLTMAPYGPPFYYANVSWDWAVGAVAGPFWTALVQAKQDPVV